MIKQQNIGDKLQKGIEDAGEMLVDIQKRISKTYG